jgi:hypothetical protein
VNVVEASNRRIPTQLVKLVAERSSALLRAADHGDADYDSFVRTVEQTYGVHIAVQKTLGPDNRPAVIDGIISLDDSAAGCQWTFRSDENETRCAMRFGA